jgi:hypothetical protein
MRGFNEGCLAIALAVGAGIPSAGCCRSVSGPTAAAASYSGTLKPGEFQFYDAVVPASTTQINLDITLNSETIPLRLRQIDPACLPTTGGQLSEFL